jgi:hypothetical protein
MKSHSKNLTTPDIGGTTIADAEDIHLTSAQVRRRYGDVSDMALFRWLADEKVGFPQPIIIGNRRYWKLSALLTFERQRADRKIELSDRHISKQRRRRRTAVGAES